MSGTDSVHRYGTSASSTSTWGAHPLSPYAHLRTVWYWPRVCCYGMSGTDLAYAPTGCTVLN
eukprot:1038651-Rhodomonas_salina.2